MKWSNMESWIIPLIQFTKVVIFALYFSIWWEIHSAPGPHPLIFIIGHAWGWMSLTALIFDLVSGLCALIRSRYSWLLVVCSTLYPVIFLLPVLSSLQPTLTLVLILLSLIELVVLRNSRIRNRYNLKPDT